MRFTIISLFFLALSGCGLARSNAISDAKSQLELGEYSDSQLCNIHVEETPFVRAERNRRNLGDCSAAHKQCRDSGYVSGTELYLACRQMIAQENEKSRQASRKLIDIGLQMQRLNDPQPQSQDQYDVYYKGKVLNCSRVGQNIDCN